MRVKKKIAVFLVVFDMIVIIFVIILKGNYTTSVKSKNVASAANVITRSNEALDSYKNEEIKNYIDQKNYEEKLKIETIEQEKKINNIVKQENSKEKIVSHSNYESVADFALQFVGNPYVAGGTSLTLGSDCSGFVMAVYANYGINLPRTSKVQSSVGSAVSLNKIEKGDIVAYGYNGSVTHTAIYIGDGKIVHASTPSLGIRVDSVNIMPVISIRRIV